MDLVEFFWQVEFDINESRTLTTFYQNHQLAKIQKHLATLIIFCLHPFTFKQKPLCFESSALNTVKPLLLAEILEKYRKSFFPNIENIRYKV
jgi:hypothetical protein